jgi:hypothetical protein
MMAVMVEMSVEVAVKVVAEVTAEVDVTFPKSWAVPAERPRQAIQRRSRQRSCED